MVTGSNDIVEFTIIYNRYKLRIYNLVLRMARDRAACEDIVQTVFLRLFENMRRIRDRKSISYWLFRTARNETFQYFKSKKLRRETIRMDERIDEISSGEDIHEKIEKKEVKSVIFHELEKMPVDQREVFLMKEYGGLSYKEIAAVMEVREDLVKSRLHDVRQRLINRIAIAMERW